MCSFDNFIKKNKEIDIDSPKWEEYISRLNLIIEFIQSSRNQQLESNLDYMGNQIIEAENAFKVKMDSLCNNTVRIVESNIVLKCD